MLNPGKAAEIRSPRNGRAVSVKERLIEEEDEEPADAGQDRADPESPAPGGPGNNECGDKWPEVRAQNNRELDVVDDSWMLVEEEEILNPHQGSSLTHAAEQAVDDAGSKVGVQTGGGCGPDACAHHDGLEEERDGQAAKKAGEGDDEKTARSDGEEVANNRPLHRGLRRIPLAITAEQLVAQNSETASSALVHIQ